jgi:hypothetical protein
MTVKPRQSWDEFCAEQEREDAAILAYQKQLREQRPGMYVNGRELLIFFGTIVGASLIAAFLLWGVFTWILDGLLKAFGR